MCNLILFLWHGETRVLFLHVLFETKYKQTKRNPQLMSDTVMRSTAVLWNTDFGFAKHWRTRSTFDETLQ